MSLLGNMMPVLRRPAESALAVAIALANEAATMNWPPITDRLFQGIQHKADMRGPC